MAKVSLRGGFSDRNGIKPENTVIQLKDFDERTRVQLLNLIKKIYHRIYTFDNCFRTNIFSEFAEFLFGYVYSEDYDEGGNYDEKLVLSYISNTTKEGTYDDVLSLIEALINYWESQLKTNFEYRVNAELNNEHKSLFDIVNECFEREYVGYRFIDQIIVPISDDYEINTINETLSCEYEPVYNHISKANEFLADRNKPDYENSIKESIIAVEAMSEIITGFKGKEATLANMLNKLEDKGVEIHGGLKSAFDKLYGYTSDANGIRHAGDIGGPASTFEEAKFMLVACCAFINYLIALNVY